MNDRLVKQPHSRRRCDGESVNTKSRRYKGLKMASYCLLANGGGIESIIGEYGLVNGLLLIIGIRIAVFFLDFLLNSLRKAISINTKESTDGEKISLRITNSVLRKFYDRNRLRSYAFWITCAYAGIGAFLYFDADKLSPKIRFSEPFLQNLGYFLIFLALALGFWSYLVSFLFVKTQTRKFIDTVIRENILASDLETEMAGFAKNYIFWTISASIVFIVGSRVAIACWREPFEQFVGRFADQTSVVENFLGVKLNIQWLAITIAGFFGWFVGKIIAKFNSN